MQQELESESKRGPYLSALYSVRDRRRKEKEIRERLVVVKSLGMLSPSQPLFRSSRNAFPQALRDDHNNSCADAGWTLGMGRTLPNAPAITLRAIFCRFQCKTCNCSS